MHRFRRLMLAAATLLVSGCSAKAPLTPTPVEPAKPHLAPTRPTQVEPSVVTKDLAAVGLDPKAIDRNADPCQDFFRFACGEWLAKTEIPADKSRWVRSFSEIHERNEELLHHILEQARTQASDPVGKVLGAYYGACMDEAAIEEARISPLKGLLDAASRIRDGKSLVAAVIGLHRHQVWALFQVSAEQDYKDATRVIAQIDQAGLGLPDRDYYLRSDAKSQEIRTAYLAHVERMLKLAGSSPKEARKGATDVMAIETALARVSKTRVERRDPQGMYNKIDRAGLVKAAPGFPWDEYFKALDHPEVQDISVTSVPFVEGLGKILFGFKPAAWRSYVRWHVLRDMAPALPKAFVDESFSMSATLTGQRQIEERWKRCVAATDDALGEYLAQPYVQSAFAGESKQAAEEMVRQVSEAFGRGLDKLAWMDEPTRQRAKQKLEAISYHIGYPKTWRQYDFATDPKSYATNLLAARAFDRKRQLGKIGKPVDREEWYITPPTVNAYYDPQKNQMVFPAGILQPPFYSLAASLPVNLGAIGMVVGHELTHGFDDSGAQFAHDGNMQNWWEPAVEKQFKDKTQCVVDQYGKFEALPGLFVNGKLTAGENIADMGGIKLAFHAYREMRKGAKEVVVADGFNEDQQFFLALAQAWCSKTREEAVRLRVTTDSHAPPHLRVNGPLANLPEFAAAFSCAEGTPMHPANTCEVW
ncbi:MAG: M13 family metallopeptidase [Deltaproteobacteria bacterium]|nr:M13 family metallopeptidase [Deltaproteobacteria bacterium]